MRHVNLGSIFWGASLVFIGALLLARNFGYSIPGWTNLARYWPALLIVYGAVKLFEYRRVRRGTERRSLFSGGEVALLVLFILSGSAITAAANLSSHFGHIFEIGELDLWDITGSNFQYTERRELQAEDGAAIQIVNKYGNVDVRPSADNRIVLEASKTVRAANQQEADRLAADFTFSITKEGFQYRVISSLDDNRARGRRYRFKSSLTIHVPRQAIVEIDNRYGRVNLSELSGDQSISNRYGEVSVRQIMGSLRVENGYGDVVVEDVTGSVNVTNSYSSVSAKKVGGSLDVANKYAVVKVSEISGNAAISNSYSPIVIRDVRGAVQITGRNNAVDVAGVGGDVTVVNSYQNVNVANALGEVTATSRNGDVTVEFQQPPKKNVSITAEFGSVHVKMPASASFVIHAETIYGSIDSEYPDMKIDVDGASQFLNGRIGSGVPQIDITARSGNVRLTRS